MPVACRSSSTRSQTPSRATGSSPTVGSSSTSSAGRLTSAWASSSRRTIPPEYVPASRSATSARPIASSASSTRALPLAARHVVEAREPRDVLAARQRGLDRELLRHVAEQPAHRHLREPRTSCPNTSTDPSCSGSSVLRTRIVVVLPAPFGPSSPNTSPARTSQVDPVDRDVVAEAVPKPADLDCGRRGHAAAAGACGSSSFAMRASAGTASSTRRLSAAGSRAIASADRGHAPVAPGVDPALPVVGERKPADAPVGCVGRAHEDPKRRELSDERADGVGSEPHRLRGAGDRDAGMAADDARELELSAGQRRELRGSAVAPSRRAPDRRHRCQQLVGQPRRRRPCLSSSHDSSVTELSGIEVVPCPRADRLAWR